MRTKLGWEVADLASISKVFTDGNWIETKDQAANGIRLIQTGNIGYGLFKDRRDKSRWINECTFERLKCTEVFPGDCLLSRLPDPVGRACLVPDTGDKMITAVDCTIVRPDERKIDSVFLVYYMQSRDYLKDVDSRCTGTTRRRISRKNLGKVKIPLPPLEEQRRIVSILEETFTGLDRIRANAKANLSDARELFTSLVDEFAVSAKWPVFSLKKLVREDCSLSYGIVQPGDEMAGGLPIVRPVDLAKGQINFDGLKRISPDRASAYERTRLQGGELLLCVRGTTGTVRVAADKLSGANVTRGIVPIRFNKQMNSRFGYYQVLSRFVQNQIQKKTYGAALMQINIKDVKELRLHCPSLDVQEKVAKRLDELTQKHAALVASCELKVRFADDLRQSLLRRAFSGELS